MRSFYLDFVRYRSPIGSTHPDNPVRSDTSHHPHELLGEGSAPLRMDTLRSKPPGNSRARMGLVARDLSFSAFLRDSRDQSGFRLKLVAAAALAVSLGLSEGILAVVLASGIAVVLGVTVAYPVWRWWVVRRR